MTEWTLRPSGWARHPFLVFPRRSLLLTLLVLVALGWQGRRLQPDGATRTLLEGDQRNLAAFEKVESILKRDVVVLIGMSGPDLFTRTGLRDLRALCESFNGMEGLVDVKSLTHSVIPVRKGFQFQMEPFVPPGDLTDARIRQIRNFSTMHPLVRNILVSEDGRNAIVTVTLRRELDTEAQQDRFYAETRERLAPLEARGYSFHLLAFPFVEREVRDTLKHDLKSVLPVALGAMLMVLLAAYRSGRFVAQVAVLQAALLATFPALLWGTGIPLNLYTAMLFPLLCGVQLTLQAHLFSAHRQAVESGETGRRALGLALRRVTGSCLLAALTTAVGLVALAVCPVGLVRQFGFAGALGLGWICLLVFGPGLALAMLLAPQPRVRMNREYRGWHALATLVERRSGWILGAGALLLGLAVFGATRVRTDIRVMEFLDPASPTRMAMAHFNETYGGFNILQIELDSGRTNGVNQTAFLNYAQQVARSAAERPEVSATYSYPDLLAMMNQIWEGGKPEALKLPGNPIMLNLFVAALQARDYPFLRALVDPEFRTAQVVVRSPDIEGESYLRVVRGILEEARRTRPAGVTVSAEGGLHTLLEADRRILRAQTDTAGVAIGSVALLLTLLWRHWRHAGLAVLVNVIPVALALALAAGLGITLNSLTVMVAAIVLGIAIDDAVHLISWWRQLRAEGVEPRTALSRTLEAKGLPIICTSLVLMAMFGAFQLFSFPPVRHFGLLSVIALAGSLASVLVLLPACLIRGHRSGKGE